MEKGKIEEEHIDNWLYYIELLARRNKNKHPPLK